MPVYDEWERPTAATAQVSSGVGGAGPAGRRRPSGKTGHMCARDRRTGRRYDTHMCNQFSLTPQTHVIFSGGDGDASVGSHAADAAAAATHRRPRRRMMTMTKRAGGAAAAVAAAAAVEKAKAPQLRHCEASAAQFLCAKVGPGRRGLGRLFVAFGDETRDEAHDMSGRLLFSIRMGHLGAVTMSVCLSNNSPRT